jgi:hypothetical protein
MEHIKVHGMALDGNLDGDAVDRDVFVFLPPGYAHEKSRRSHLWTTTSGPSGNIAQLRWT